MTTETKLRKQVWTRDGWCKGPRYGVVYTAPAGETGYIAGYRSHASEGLGLMGEKRFSRLVDAKQYASERTDY